MINDGRAKAVQKKYKDAKSYVKPHNITINDQVLLRQQQTKSNPPYNPDPYKVVEINGHQITAERDGNTLTRDAQKWKTINLREKPDYARENYDNSLGMYTDEEGSHVDAAVRDPTGNAPCEVSRSNTSAESALEITRSGGRDCRWKNTTAAIRKHHWKNPTAAAQAQQAGKPATTAQEEDKPRHRASVREPPRGRCQPDMELPTNHPLPQTCTATVSHGLGTSEMDTKQGWYTHLIQLDWSFKNSCYQ